VESLNTLILAGGSEFYNHPEKYNIHFRSDKDELYKNHYYFIPTDLWYSEEPYIDQAVRVKRLERIVTELHNQGVGIGAFATAAVENLIKKG
jgi:hypothetical protein